MMLTLISATLIILALGQAASLLGIWFRYAIPRAPKVFHWLLLFPMLLSIFSALGLAWVLLTGVARVFTMDAFMLFLIYCGSQAVVYWVLVLYWFWWWTRGVCGHTTGR